jgi:dihydroxyacetone kinase
MLNGILNCSGASIGDKTMICARALAANAAPATVPTGDPRVVLSAASQGSKDGAVATRAMESKRGRSKKLGLRSVGHMDPSAASARVDFSAISAALPR